MKKLIFHLSNFFGSGHFLIHAILKKWPKIDRSQKSQNAKKSATLCPSTTRRNFWILFMLWLDFHDWFLKLWIFISRWRNIFPKKFLAQIIIFGGYFGWLNVGLNQKILDELYCVYYFLFMIKNRKPQIRFKIILHEKGRIHIFVLGYYMMLLQM